MEICAMGFRNLLVYQQAFALNKSIYLFLKNDKSLPYYVKNQLGKACLSIMLNIAEGTGRATANDQKHFYIMAAGSLKETKAIIVLLEEVHEINSPISESWRSQLNSIETLLKRLIQSQTRKPTPFQGSAP